MKIGDAESEIWVEGGAGRSYFCFVQSHRRRGGKVVYCWRVETWLDTVDDKDAASIGKDATGTEATWYEAFAATLLEANRRESVYKKEAGR